MKKLKLSKIDRFRKFLQNDRECVAEHLKTKLMVSEIA